MGKPLKKTSKVRKVAPNSIEALVQRSRQQEMLGTMIIPYGDYDKRARPNPHQPNSRSADYQGPMGRGNVFGEGTRDRMPEFKPDKSKKGGLI